MNNFIDIIKNFFNNLKKQRLIFITLILGGIILILIIFSIIFKLLNKKMSYEKLENTLIVATEKYMKDNPESLPTKDNPTSVISATTLIENKYLKNLRKYVKDSSCTANINVYYEEGDYIYQSFLTCNNYKTEKLFDVIKEKNEISSFGEGLYEMNNEHIYRGQNPNNYLLFNDELWRIVKVNQKGQFIIIKEELNINDYGVFDDRYNTEADLSKGVNNFSLSRALSNIRGYYQERYIKYNNNFLDKFDICDGKRSETEINKDGLVECNSILKDQYIAFLPIYDYMNASLDNTCTNTLSKECQNYNYLVNSKDKWWTITANNKNTYDVYYINYSGKIISDEAASSANYRYILALDRNTLYKNGIGSIDEPFEIR